MRGPRVLLTGASTGLVLATSALTGCTQATPVAAPGASATSTSPHPTTSATTTTSPATATRPATTHPATSAVKPTSRPAHPAKPAAASPRTTSTPTPAPTPKAAPTPAGLPLPFDTANAGQVITVTAAAYGDTQATLQAWSRAGTGWTKRGPAIPAWLGYAGLSTHAREGYTGTPVGSFGLTHAFGNDANPGVRLPYFQADANDWWNGDSSSAGYNIHQHCVAAQCPFRTGESENLHDAGWVYGYAAVIDYNMAPARPGGGSAFFLHVTQDHPTQGCVSIAQAPLVDLLRWLDPAQHPRIQMGVS